MTKYRITRYAGEAQPCAIADPAGCFYSTGEVDRVFKASKDNMDEMQTLITDMLAWFKWTQPYPTICVQEFISRGNLLMNDKSQPPDSQLTPMQN